MEKFKDRIKYLRNRDGYTGEQLGDKLDLTKTAISYWETGKSIPSDEILIELSKIFDVSIDYLLGNSDIENLNTYGNHSENMKYFSDKPELLEIYKDIHDSNTLQLLFDQARDLTPEDLETVLMIIKGIKSERGQ